MVAVSFPFTLFSKQTADLKSRLCNYGQQVDYGRIIKTMTDEEKRLASVHLRIKKGNCCIEWKNDRDRFIDWYIKQLKLQKEVCHYCHLEGDTEITYGRGFREGRRGKNLEVERKDTSGQYSPDNCVLACYPCTNAKSDVFTYEEFLEIGKVINRLKTKKIYPIAF